MAVPGYQDFMRPLLAFASDGQEHSQRETIEHLADVMQLSDADRQELLPSGNQTYLNNRVSWARIYLGKAGLLESTRRGYFRITEQGKRLYATRPAVINNAVLDQYPEFRAFRMRSPRPASPAEETQEIANPPLDITPDELIETAYQKLKDSLADEVLRTVKSCSPYFFEQLVVDLLVKMGYGGSRKEAGQATKASGDEGIDGIIKEDRLGLDVIYLQAKRWENQVSRPEVQKFAGALQGQRARKGIFITTSNFSSGAIEFCRHIDSKIILIDGEQLAKLMIDFNVGVAVSRTLEIKRIDTDYFEGQ